MLNLENIMPTIDKIDILIFPKSICELSLKDIEYISDYLTSNTNDLYVMASYRNNDSLLADDVNKIKNYVGIYKIRNLKSLVENLILL